jgi:hypothetical protein
MDDEYHEAQLDGKVATELLPLTAMITKMFGPEFVQFIKEKFGSLRNFYETSSATTQCNRTVGSLIPNSSLCWICGYDIVVGVPEERAFAPECEHIFPVAQALFFIGLYSNDIKDNANYIEKLKLEYAWAHHVCNQIKSDKHFIEDRVEGPYRRWSVSRVKIQEFLNDILRRGNTYAGGGDMVKNEIKAENITQADWVARQTEVIHRKCYDLIDTIPPGHDNFWILATVSDLALTYQTSGFVPEAIERYRTIGKPTQMLHFTEQGVISFYNQWAEYMMKNVAIRMAEYLGKPIRRYSREEKVYRSLKVSKLLDNSLIEKINRDALRPVYDMIPNNNDKPAQFVNVIHYLTISIILERISRILNDEDDIKNPTLIKIKTEFSNNIKLIADDLTTKGLGRLLEFLNGLLSTTLKGASRKRR